MEKIEEKQKDVETAEKIEEVNEEEDTQTKVIKLPLWIIYLIMIMLAAAVMMFIVYKIYGIKNTKETFKEEIKLQTVISLEENTIDVGEKKEITLKDSNEELKNKKNINNKEIVEIKSRCGKLERELKIIKLQKKKPNNWQQSKMKKKP